MTLGQKIRALRKERKMTQSTLAGSEITRNMLSRIESDSALPSLPTLLYLAKQLNVPAGYLLSENLSLFTCQKEEFLPALKHWYSLGNYKEVLRLYRRDFDGADDEIAYLVAVSATECAKEAVHRGTMKTASEHLALAREMAEKTVYADKRLRAVIALLEALLGNVQMPRFALSASEYTSFSSDATWEDLYRYLTDDISEYAYHDPLIKEHVDAKKLLLAGKHKDALAALTAIEAKRSTPGFSVLVLFRLYADIEACYKEMFNYEEAYRYASKRLALLSAFRA